MEWAGRLAEKWLACWRGRLLRGSAPNLSLLIPLPPKSLLPYLLHRDAPNFRGVRTAFWSRCSPLIGLLTKLRKMTRQNAGWARLWWRLGLTGCDWAWVLWEKAAPIYFGLGGGSGGLCPPL